MSNPIPITVLGQVERISARAQKILASVERAEREGADMTVLAETVKRKLAQLDDEFAVLEQQSGLPLGELKDALSRIKEAHSET